MMPPARLVAGLAAAVVFAAACSEFSPVNQYDSRYDIRVSIAGPDSAATAGDVLTFTVRTTPAWTGTAPVWSNKGGLESLGNGRFRLLAVGYDPVHDTISVALGPHRATYPVTIRQRVASLKMQSNGLPWPDTLRYDALEEARSLVAVPFDSGGTEVALPCCSGLRPRFASRDTTVVRIDMQNTLSGVPYSSGNGGTWIVASLDGVSDSVPALVRQLPVKADCAPAYSVTIGLRDSVQLGVARWYDRNGYAVDPAPTTTWWTLKNQYGAVIPDTIISVTPAGMVHSTQYYTDAIAFAQWRTQDGAANGEAGSCYVYVR